MIPLIKLASVGASWSIVPATRQNLQYPSWIWNSTLVGLSYPEPWKKPAWRMSSVIPVQLEHTLWSTFKFQNGIHLLCLQLQSYFPKHQAVLKSCITKGSPTMLEALSISSWIILSWYSAAKGTNHFGQLGHNCFLFLCLNQEMTDDTWFKHICKYLFLLSKEKVDLEILNNS